MEFGSKNAIVPVCLNGKNYGLWEFNLRCFIQGQGLYGYIDGSETRPQVVKNAQGVEDKTPLKKWISENSRVMSWILGSVEPHIGINLRPYQTAADMWAYLTTIYHQGSDARKYQLDLEIHEYNQGQKNMQDYYSGFMSLWLEYNSILYSSVPSTALITVQELQEKNMRDQFLMKLRPEFEPVRRQLMARSPVPNLTECFRELMREEQTMTTRLRLEEALIASDATNMALLSKGKISSKVGKDVKCYSCQGFGHVAKECNKKFCNYCKKEGHILPDCRKRPQNRTTAAFQALAVPAQQVSAGQQRSHDQGQTTTSQNMQQITPEAVQHMIQSALSAMGLSGNANSKWYVDSGASNHMSSAPNNFVTLTPYTGTEKISTADGTDLPIKGVGTVLLSNKPLDDVLLVPKLTSNLISVGQLVENNYRVLFTQNGCVIQDQATGKVIKMAHRSGRLFLIDDKQNLTESIGSALAVSRKDDPWVLWHRKLGHLNSDSLSLMFQNGSIPIKNVSSSPCSSCLLWKK